MHLVPADRVLFSFDDLNEHQMSSTPNLNPVYTRALAVSEENWHFLCLCHVEESALAVDKGKANMNKSEREIKKLPKLSVHEGLICVTVL